MLGKSHVSQSRSKSFCRYAGVHLALQEDAGVEACGASFPVALAVKSSSKPPKKNTNSFGRKSYILLPLSFRQETSSRVANYQDQQGAAQFFLASLIAGVCHLLLANMESPRNTAILLLHGSRGCLKSVDFLG